MDHTHKRRDMKMLDRVGCGKAFSEYANTR